MADEVAMMMRIMKAQRHLFAHLSSTWRMSAMICLRSSSVFSGIQAGIESVVEAGSRKGESKMKAPKNQKGGNTTHQDQGEGVMSVKKKKVHQNRNLQNPNLKRYMASVTGSGAWSEYSGRGTADSSA